MARRERWGTIRKLPSGRYQAQTPVIQGKRIKAPDTFATLGEARGWLSVIRKELATGGMEPVQSKTSKVRVTEVYYQMMTFMENNGYSPGTLRTYKSTWSAHLEDYWGSRKIGSVTTPGIREWFSKTEWKSYYSQKKAYLLLNRILRFALDRGFIAILPQPKISIPNRPVRDYQVATPEQITMIREAMPRELQVAVDLAAWCAMRFGEIVALRGKDIDLNRGVVRIHRAVKRGPGGALSEGNVKTKAGRRTVAIPPETLKRIKEHYKIYKIKQDDLVVWQPGSEGKEWLRNKELHTRYDVAVAAAGLQGMRFHDLRHTGLTLAGEAGATLAELMARAGHSDIEVAMVYQHASLERDRAIAAKLGG